MSLHKYFRKYFFQEGHLLLRLFIVNNETHKSHMIPGLGKTRHHILITTEIYNHWSEITWKQLSAEQSDRGFKPILVSKKSKTLLAALTSVSCLRNAGIFFIIWAKLLIVIWGKIEKKVLFCILYEQTIKKPTKLNGEAHK